MLKVRHSIVPAHVESEAATRLREEQRKAGKVSDSKRNLLKLIRLIDNRPEAKSRIKRALERQSLQIVEQF